MLIVCVRLKSADAMAQNANPAPLAWGVVCFESAEAGWLPTVPMDDLQLIGAAVLYLPPDSRALENDLMPIQGPDCAPSGLILDDESPIER